MEDLFIKTQQKLSNTNTTIFLTEKNGYYYYQLLNVTQAPVGTTQVLIDEVVAVPIGPDDVDKVDDMQTTIDKLLVRQASADNAILTLMDMLL
jgi:hypothetical protein